MSWEARDWAFEQWSKLDCSPGAKQVLFALGDFSRDHGDGRYVCWPSRETIAKRIGLSQRGVDKALSQLVEERMLERTPRHRPNGQRDTDLFHLQIPNAWLAVWRSRNRMGLEQSASEPTKDVDISLTTELSPYGPKGLGELSSPPLNGKPTCWRCEAFLAKDHEGVALCSPCERELDNLAEAVAA